MKNNLPVYNSGVLRVCEIVSDNTTDYPVEKLQDTGMQLGYREISVFDRTRFEFQQANKEITTKIVIPQYKSINSRCVVIINGEQHEVYNATDIVNKNGFLETEITLIKPNHEREFVND